MIDRVEQQFGDYFLTKNLGAGGFADVYLGEHIYLGTQAAVKVLKGAFTPEDLAQFRAEAQTIARLEHPHIVRVITFSVAKIGTVEIPFLVMEYAPNGTLRHRYPKDTRLSLDTVVHYVKQVADALQYAHTQKIIHRDIKPENMLLGRHDEVLLSDFGIALMTPQTGTLATQEMAGTVAYMAPEQITGKPRPPSDQYALAVVAYEWLSGEHPFQGKPWHVINQHLNVPPPPLHEKIPELPPAVEQVVLRALAKVPQQRFPTVQEFATALEQASQPVRKTARPPSSSPANQAAARPTPLPSAQQPIPPIQVASPANQAVAPPTPIPSTHITSPANQAVAKPTPIPATQPGPQPAVLRLPVQETASPPGTPDTSTLKEAASQQPLSRASSTSKTTTTQRQPARNRVALLVGLLVLVVLGGTGLLIYPLTHRTTPTTTNPTAPANPVTIGTSSGAMFGFDLQRTHFNPGEHSLAPTNVSGLVQDWTATTGNIIDTSPTVANGMVYIGSDDHHLYAFKASCGNASCQPQWTASTGGLVRSSPAIANGMLFVGSFDHNLYAFKAAGCGNASCQPIWTTPIGGIIRSSPVVANGEVYVGSEDGRLYAFDASTGRLLWTAATGNIIYYSSPAINDGVVYIGSEDGKLYAFNTSTGKFLWAASTGGMIFSSPAVANGIVYVGSGDGKLYAFKISDCANGSCAPLWMASTGPSINSSPAIANGTVYVGADDGKLYAFNASTGRLLWTASTAAVVRSSPTVANGVVYVGSDDHHLYAFNAAGCGNASCAPLWRASTGGLIFSSPAVVNGVVYVGSSDKMLYAFHLRGATP